ncbi:MAG: hypothetical protein EOP50_11390 [Sphingobacteriales bacterium]|nr:MAG: hypothetical protein EOP50_11390 [Sphingobacteriales bacterium]
MERDTLYRKPDSLTLSFLEGQIPGLATMRTIYFPGVLRRHRNNNSFPHFYASNKKLAGAATETIKALS